MFSLTNPRSISRLPPASRQTQNKGGTRARVLVTRECEPPPHTPMQPPTDQPAAPNQPPPPPTFALPSLGTDDWLFDTRRADGVPAASRPPDDATRFKKAVVATRVVAQRPHQTAWSVCHL